MGKIQVFYIHIYIIHVTLGLVFWMSDKNFLNRQAANKHLKEHLCKQQIGIFKVTGPWTYEYTCFYHVYASIFGFRLGSMVPCKTETEFRMFCTTHCNRKLTSIL